MTSPHPITLYSHKKGPNAWKVALVLEELGVPYQTVYLEFPEAKTEEFLAKNPYGKLPVLEDKSTGLVLFESGSIVSYLLNTYDKAFLLHHPISPSTLSQHYLELSFLELQTTAQGPTCGHKIWLTRKYPAPAIASATEYFDAEIKRIVSVLDAHLRRQGTQYLVGDRVSYADLMFVPMYLMLDVFVPGWDAKSEFPVWGEWLDRLEARSATQVLMERKRKLNEA